MSDKKKVYVETSVISNLTARPSHNVIDAALQSQTINWWTFAKDSFDLYGSELVMYEASHGDAVAAQLRLEAIKELRMLKKEIESAGYACPVICIPPALEGGAYGI